MREVSNALQVTFSAPGSLRFVAHVGLAEGFPRNLDSTGEQVPERERDWRRRWEHALLGEDPDDPFEVAWNWIHAPDFPALRDTSRVSGWCLARRAALREDRLRENEPFSIRMDGAVHDVGANRLVREWERGAGRTVRSCILEVNFVRGLGTHHREAYLNRLVLGETYLESRNAPLLRSASKARISRFA